MYAPWVLFGVLVCIVAAVAIIAIARERERRRVVESTLATPDAAVHTKPDIQTKALAFSRVGSPNLRKGSGGVAWCAFYPDGVCLLEHRYTVYAGNHAHTHYHTIAGMPLGPAWPDLLIQRAGVLRRLFGGLGKGSRAVYESEEFTNRWRVTCADAEVALVSITPELQAWCLSLPQDWWVCVSDGVCSVWASKRVDASLLPAMLRRLGELRAMLAAAYDPEALGAEQQERAPGDPL